MAENSQPLPKPALDNRSDQLDPQHPTYHRDRGAEPTEANRLSTEIT